MKVARAKAPKIPMNIIVELPSYVSEAGTLNVYYKARFTKGLVLERYHATAGDDCLAGTYRVEKTKARGRYKIFWAPRGHKRMQVTDGAIFNEIIAITRQLVAFGG
jgi:hypothetical protein